MAALVSIVAILPQAVVPAAAASERAIYLYYTHTKETARIVFKRNGQYVQSGLQELNVFLRDWRRNEPAQMDPRLFDLVWEVYQEVGATQPVNVVSAYRSPQTNAMLRSSSSGVAENSQHIKGRAMDFFIPGVPLAKLRAVAMRKQVGGVGFYPTSGSPFVHLDVGSVRAWPRMTRAQLKEIFPDGRTMHLPTDGKPLSQEGYQTAMNGWKQCHRYPCDGSSSGTQTADSGSGKSLMDLFFGGKESQPAAVAAPVPSRAAEPAPVQVAAVAPQPAMPSAAPMPAPRPAAFGGVTAPVETAAAAEPVLPFSTTGSAPLDPSELVTVATAPIPAMKSETLRVATASGIPSGDAVTAIAALTAPMPQPRLIMSDRPEAMTAYAAPMAQDAGAQRALEMIIATETTASTAPAPVARTPILPLTGSTNLRTASLGGGQPVSSAVSNLFDGTFGAAQQDAPVAAALAEHLAKRPTPGAMRSPEMIAPDLEHIADVFTAPVSVTSDHFANIWDHDEADFDPTAEMGKYVTVMRVGDNPAGLSHTSFVTAKPVALVAN
ncbi:Uncharacterized conserved protein YcbK, DUF882 family [Devosia sp. YR412]|uniref:DUF882 domain-containing protein n=1 Tax=Devosia sp. YR412 TaxID=1881030 RepID=UPI0008D08E0E|nr:DUF882 domain-containing protein [Devosia sp. YR412]SEQ14621.1 Uncharacterized conserved protein YcbK, DUF882 family [Devosia sp. YR412]